jgi:hypothetical protein
MYAARNPYQHNRAFFSQYVHLIPNAIIPEIEKYTPAEEYLRSAWGNMGAYITRLLHIKENINQSFK